MRKATVIFWDEFVDGVRTGWSTEARVGTAFVGVRNRPSPKAAHIATHALAEKLGWSFTKMTRAEWLSKCQCSPFQPKKDA